MNEKMFRRGFKHPTNPFMSTAISDVKGGVKIIKGFGNRMMIVSEDTGEIVGPAGFYKQEHVDSSKFLKLYISGVKALAQLSPAGTKVFEILYMEMQRVRDSDLHHMSYSSVDQDVTPMGKTTFYAGVKELVEKRFIAESTKPFQFYVNPSYMWNGDRLAFVSEYTRKRIGEWRVDDDSQQAGCLPETPENDAIEHEQTGKDSWPKFPLHEEPESFSG